MSREDIRKLLGGYATGTLTPNEQQALFEAALDDQELFDALAREQSLRDLLRDPSAKATILAALDAKPRGWWASWWRPASLAAATAGIAVLAVLLVRTNAPKPQPVTVAIATPPETPQPVEAEPPKSEPPAPAPQRTAAPPAAKTPRIMPKQARDSVSVGSGAGGYVGGASAGVAGGVVGGVIGGAPGVAPFAVPTAPPPAQAKPDAATPPAPQTKAEAAPPPPPPFLATAPAPKRLEASTAPRAQDLFLGAQIPASMAAESRFLPTERVQDQATPRQRAEVQSGRSETLMIGAALSSALTMAPQSGVRYAILRRSAGRKLEELNSEDVKSGDEVSLRFETNAQGFFNAWVRSDAGTWRPLATFTVERMTPYITPALNQTDNEIHVWFSRQRQMAMSGPAPPALGLQPATNLTERAGALTYVVTSSAGADAQQVRFTIRLR